MKLDKLIDDIDNTFELLVDLILEHDVKGNSEYVTELEKIVSTLYGFDKI